MTADPLHSSDPHKIFPKHPQYKKQAVCAIRDDIIWYDCMCVTTALTPYSSYLNMPIHYLS